MTGTPDKSSNDYQRQIDTLAKATARTQRGFGYKVLLSPAKDFRRFSDWALLVVGGSLALLVPNLKDLLEIYSLPQLKMSFGLLLFSGIVGLFSKFVFSLFEDKFAGADKDYDALVTSAEEYQKQVQKISEQAQTAGVQVTDTLDHEAFLKPVEVFSPSVMKAFDKYRTAEKSNPDYYWQKALQCNGVHSLLVMLQIALILSGFSLLLIAMKAPNKAPEPTPGSVTPRAASGISK